MDRDPLEKVQDKQIENKVDWSAVGTNIPTSDLNLEDMRNARNMALMFGLEDGFGEDFKNADYMLSWAKQFGNPLQAMKKVIKQSGYQDTGKLLFKKIYQYIRLQENIDYLKSEQEVLGVH